MSRPEVETFNTAFNIATSWSRYLPRSINVVFYTWRINSQWNWTIKNFSWFYSPSYTSLAGLASDTRVDPFRAKIYSLFEGFILVFDPEFGIDLLAGTGFFGMGYG